MGDAEQVAISRVAVHPVIKGVSRSKARSQDNSAVLNNAGWPIEQSANRSDLRIRQAAQHFLKPIGVEPLHVVIHQTKIRTLRILNGNIVQARKIEGTVNANDARRGSVDRSKVID